MESFVIRHAMSEWLVNGKEDAKAAKK